MVLLSAWLLASLPGSAETRADVHVYVGAVLPEGALETALREVESIFSPGEPGEPGEIGWRWMLSPRRPDRTGEPIVTVVIQSRPPQPVVHGCSRNLHDHRLGHTHLGARRVTLWTEQVARAVDGDWDRTDAPEVDATSFARALGRVLAHELGHLFLRLNGHRNGGLMRSSFSHRSLVSRGNRAFRLSGADLKTIRTLIQRHASGY